MDPTVLLPWLPAGFIHCWEHMWLFPSPVPPTVMGIHFEDQDCISLPSPSLSRHSTAWQGQGAARQSGVRRWGATCYLTVRCRTLEMPCVGDEELLLLRSSTDRSRALPFSEPGLPFSVLSMSYLVAHVGTGTDGQGETSMPADTWGHSGL